MCFKGKWLQNLRAFFCYAGLVSFHWGPTISSFQIHLSLSISVIEKSHPTSKIIDSIKSNCYQYYSTKEGKEEYEFLFCSQNDDNNSLSPNCQKKKTLCHLIANITPFLTALLHSEITIHKSRTKRVITTSTHLPKYMYSILCN